MTKHMDQLSKVTIQFIEQGTNSNVNYIMYLLAGKSHILVQVHPF